MAFLVSAAYAADPQRSSGRNPSGLWAIAAYAVIYWQAPTDALISASGRVLGPSRKLTPNEEAQRGVWADIAVVLFLTIASWTIVIGALHFAWTSRSAGMGRRHG